ncbi:MAG: hypothetical protein ACRENS_13995 [Candidatus Eiseniibacteriota bacterium]
MNRSRIRSCLAALALAISVAGAAPTRAQAPGVAGPRRIGIGRAMDRVSYVLDQTDRRIEEQDRVLGPLADSRLVAELTTAREIQEHARDAFAAGQPRLALRLTLEAREHIQQAGAVSRGLPDAERVSIQLERTRDLIGRSRERLVACDHPGAHDAIDAAEMMQARADSALREGRSLAAQELSMEARERTFRALQSCNLEEDLPGTVNFALKRTDQVLARARDHATGNPAAQQSLDEAAKLQARAQQEFRQQHVEQSLKLTHSARAAARRATGQPPRR